MNEVNISDSFERNNENDKYWRELRDRSIKRKCKCKIRSVFNFSLEFYIYSLAEILVRELHLYAYLLTTNAVACKLKIKQIQRDSELIYIFDRENEFEEVALWTDKYV